MRGQQGLGCAEAFGCIDEIDLIVGAFGKAMASVGGYVICHQVIKDYLINTMRPLIFSTALPPMNVAWTAFVLDNIIGMTAERSKLQMRHKHLIGHIKSLGFDISALPMASICCSPPDSVPAACLRRSFRRGK